MQIAYGSTLNLASSVSREEGEVLYELVFFFSEYCTGAEIFFLISTARWQAAMHFARE